MKMSKSSAFWRNRSRFQDTQTSLGKGQIFRGGNLSDGEKEKNPPCPSLMPRLLPSNIHAVKWPVATISPQPLSHKSHTGGYFGAWHCFLHVRLTRLRKSEGRETEGRAYEGGKDLLSHVKCWVRKPLIKAGLMEEWPGSWEQMRRQKGSSIKYVLKPRQPLSFITGSYRRMEPEDHFSSFHWNFKLKPNQVSGISIQQQISWWTSGESRKMRYRIQQISKQLRLGERVHREQRHMRTQIIPLRESIGIVWT